MSNNNDFLSGNSVSIANSLSDNTPFLIDIYEGNINKRYAILSSNMYYDIKSETWMLFCKNNLFKRANVGTWIRCTQAHFREILKNIVLQKCKELRQSPEYNVDMETKISAIENKINEKTVRLINNILKQFIKLKTNNVIDFSKIDNNRHLIGFNDGLYDITKKEFRKGTYDDYVTLSVGYNYIEKTLHQKQLELFLETIFPYTKDKDDVLNWLSSLFTTTPLNRALVLYGDQVSKILFLNLLSSTFGNNSCNYILKLPLKYLSHCNEAILETCLIKNPRKRIIIFEYENVKVKRHIKTFTIKRILKGKSPYIYGCQTDRIFLSDKYHIIISVPEDKIVLIGNDVINGQHSMLHIVEMKPPNTDISDINISALGMDMLKLLMYHNRRK